MNHIKETNLLSEYKSVRIKLTRQFSMWSLLTALICLAMTSAVIAQRTGNKKVEQQEIETLQKLRGNQFAIKDYLQRVENEQIENSLTNDFDNKRSAFSKKPQLNAPSYLAGVDNTFNGSLSDGSTRVEAVAVQSDGKIIVGGSFPIVNGVRRDYLARLNPDGTIDEAFNIGNTGPNNNVQAIQIQADGKILIGGFFSSYNGTSRNRIARLNSDGTLDTTFDPGSGANSTVYDILLLPNGKIMVSGIFNQYNAATANSIARLNDNGSLDTSFAAPAINNVIYQVALQSDGKVIIVGNFSSIGGRLANLWHDSI